MTIAAAIQAQMLQSLLQAMQATDAGLKAGASLRAVFAGWATPDGQAPAEGERAQAQALIAGKPVTLTLAADAARVAALRPGAVMTIAVDESPAGSRPAEARLVAVAPPEGEGLERAASAAPAACPPRRPGQPRPSIRRWRRAWRRGPSRARSSARRWLSRMATARCSPISRRLIRRRMSLRWRGSLRRCRPGLPRRRGRCCGKACRLRPPRRTC